MIYKRLTHLTEWTSQIQGTQQTHIPDDVFDAILLELSKRKTTNLQDLRPAEVKDILKKLKLNRYYEHIQFIMHRLTGREPLQMAPHIEERLKTMFRQIQAPFIKHAPRLRQNFMSYSFVLNKLVQLIGHDEYLPSFPLLKSPEKLRAQDAIWQKICADLGWEFVPSL